MRLCTQAVIVAVISLATPAVAIAAQPKQQEVSIDIIVSPRGRCSLLRIAGRDFTCRAVRYFHSPQGRAYFTIAVDDPADGSHVISFSGEKARREQQRLYELTIDRMLLNSKDRPKLDGLRVPLVELSTGTCTQLGDFAAMQISSISCTARDNNGKMYELKFESDGSPIAVQKISQYPLTEERRNAKLREQFECRRRAFVAKILPRDLTAYLVQCLGESGQKADTPQ